MNPLRIAIIAVFLGATPAKAEQDALDRCESKLRVCYRQCLGANWKNTPPVCDHFCTTSWCEGVPGSEKTLTEFLKWKETKGRTWL